ncbi:MAG: DUF1697 domain-containing protein [Acidimicrobiales bacterium]
MARSVALFRGINVGRAKQVAMSDLRGVFADLGYGEIVTLLRSGNVVFRRPQPGGGESAGDPDAVPLEEAQRVEAAILERTGVSSRALILSDSALRSVAEQNPLVARAHDPSRMVVTFVDAMPPPGELVVPDPGELEPEALHVGAAAVYQWCPDGVSNSRVPLAFWRPFGPRTTARNWRTVTRLVELTSATPTTD